ncbi:MAG: hypothetical protein DI556_16170 [Rhodovulum sulfidophilum]|uniref:DUF4174 domain-containing protein n=1 Tax=Rhodovulum sulfidophilum TaxID=35806 RepID=A0A2W5N2L8_RHOSU|nr:MAG: hypothetical protein DI556_16170 [Rhodovulum sulfidophilum]
MILRLLFLALVLAGPVRAQDAVPAPVAPVSEAPDDPTELPDPPAVPELADLMWVARPLVIFSDSDRDPRYIQQMRMIEAGMTDLTEREVIVLTDTEPAAAGPLRRDLRPRGFGVVLIDIDGKVALRRPQPTPVRDLVSLIDRMPSRREETGSRRP